MDLKNKLTEFPQDNAKKFLAYVNDARAQEAKPSNNGKPKSTPVTSNSTESLYSLFVKFYNLGLTIDGINVVITGKDMAMVTYHGYKNKVLQTYPSATFDVQLVREGDIFKVSKESGSILYTHEFGEPFSNSQIIGAYCVIRIGDAEYFEALNPSDYAEMKNSSKQSYLWDKWSSEFWLKSVLKRACKRHFNDVIADIDKVDNEGYGLDLGEELADEEISEQIQKAKKREDFAKLLTRLSPEQKKQATPLITQRMKELKDATANTSTPAK